MASPFSMFQPQRPPTQGGGIAGLAAQRAGGRQPPPSMPGQTPGQGPGGIMGRAMGAAGGGTPQGGGATGRAGGMLGGMFGTGGGGAPQGGTAGAASRISGMFGGGAPQAPAAQGPRMAPRMPQMGFAMSDEASKQEVERLRERVRDLGGGADAGHAAASSGPDFATRLAGAAKGFQALSDERSKERSEVFRGVSNNEYEYKPEFRDQPGAGHGKFRGPMADELRPLGVTARGEDGMERVNMERLPLEVAGEVGDQRRELDELRQRLADLEGNPDAQLDVAGGRR